MMARLGVANVAWQALDATTGIPSMIGDVQTLADPHKSRAKKLMAGATSSST